MKEGGGPRGAPGEAQGVPGLLCPAGQCFFVMLIVVIFIMAIMINVY